MFPLFRTLLSFFFAAYDDAAVDKHHGNCYQRQQCGSYIRKFYTSIYSPAEERSCEINGAAIKTFGGCVQ